MTAAATAAGFNYLQHERQREYREREFGKVCPECFERIPVTSFETHVFIAHSAEKVGSEING